MSHKKKTRYAIVGLGGRSAIFSEALLKSYKDTSELVALCDVNKTRMDYHNKTFLDKYQTGPFPTYKAENFEQMISEMKPDTVIVTTIDRTHHKYIIRAMELGCDVISEKPMTTDAVKCRAIFDAIERTGRKLKVTFNYRYSPSRTKVKELLLDGAIGKVNSVHFEWLLDTNHGADYYRRWHRDKINSGGLMVHKSTHHFDLVNWWLDSCPEMVFALGQLSFYGKVNAEARGVSRFYQRGTNDPNATDDPFALDLHSHETLKGLYLDAEHEDGYQRDQSVFGDGINIEDTMSVMVRYRNGTQLTYSLTSYAPWEGYRIAFNGTGGRIEFTEVERPYVNSGGGSKGEGENKSREVILHRLWEKPSVVELPEAKGSHGGGDVVMLEDIFGEQKAPDRFGRAATHIDGAKSILTGIAANESFATRQPIYVENLFSLV